MKTLVVIFGPPAVGKMTVGRELSRLTGFPLFHNHMTLEAVAPVFGWGTPQFHRLVGEFRRRVIEEAVGSDLPGLIFTYVWALNDPADKAFIDELMGIFERAGERVCFLELADDLDVRLVRNRSELRLAEKPSKRDVEFTERDLLADEQRYVMNSNDDFFYPERHLKIVNTQFAPDAVAEAAVRHFELPRVAQ